jgi:hypothetical protein
MCQDKPEPEDTRDKPCGAEPEARAEVESRRYCLTCKKVTPFTFTYAEGYLIKAQCISCGTVERDRRLLAKVFMEDLIDRAFDAAKRETKRALHDPVGEAGGLPRKVMQKSVREIQRILNIFKE